VGDGVDKVYLANATFH